MNGEIKRLYRSRTDRMLFGVCGGLGEYFNIDPTLFRALFLLLVLSNGIGIFLYLFLTIIIPNKPVGSATKEGKGSVEEAAKDMEKKAGEIAEEMKQGAEAGTGKRNILGFVVVFFGLILLAGQFYPNYLRWLTGEVVGAILIVLVGIYLIVKK